METHYNKYPKYYGKVHECVSQWPREAQLTTRSACQRQPQLTRFYPPTGRSCIQSSRERDNCLGVEYLPRLAREAAAFFPAWGKAAVAPTMTKVFSFPPRECLVL